MRNPGRFGVLTLLVERISDCVCRKHSRLAHVVRFSAHILIIVGLSAVTVACGEATQEWDRVEKLGPRTYCISAGWVSTRFRMRETSLAWRPDGSEIVFSLGPDIHATSRDGRELRTLAVVWPPGAEMTPWNTTTAFSLAPDGSRMVYATCEFADPTAELVYDLHELALLNLDRPDLPPRRLTTNGVIDYYPVWSPDGQRLAYLRGLPNEAYAVNPYRLNRELTPGSLYVMSADGTGKRSVPGGEALIGPPRWSPDGRWLAFLNDDGEAGLGLYVVDADRAVRRRLSNAVSEVSWSPDSQQLAFIRRDGERRALYTITVTADDAAEQWVVDLPDSTAPPQVHPPPPLPLVAWSPSGAHIAYECDDWRLCIVAPGGTRIGGSLYGRAAAWSPDGSRLAVVVVVDPEPQKHNAIWRDYVRRHLLPLVGDDRSITVYTVAPDGSDLRPLVREREDGGLVAAEAT